MNKGRYVWKKQLSSNPTTCMDILTQSSKAGTEQ